ncbi:MAG: tyrosine--tRNA ligase [Minisyncoccia bacterium]
MFGLNKSKVIVDESKIEELLTRGVDRIYPSKEGLKSVLLSGKRLRLYQGFDPTGDKLHIGHMVGLRKHKQWQDLGHEVIFLIGDGTGLAGDPSGKKKTREKFFTQEELRENAKNYLSQAERVIDFGGTNPVKVMYNGDWLNKLNYKDILTIAQNFSVQQLIERDMFQERLKFGETINMREFLYPLFQGYDSVAMDVDLELGATDQTFNMLTGRTLLKVMKNKEKFVMTTPLLLDSKGVKIGKSEGNVIGIGDKPVDIFGKIMSLGDDSIIPLFTLLTDVLLEDINSYDITNNPLELKKKVAKTIISELYSEKEASDSEVQFENTFSKGQVPKDIDEVSISKNALLVEVLVSKKIVSSKSDFRRLMDEGAITLMDKDIKIENLDEKAESGVYKIGKRRFIKINLK